MGNLTLQLGETETGNASPLLCAILHQLHLRQMYRMSVIVTFHDDHYLSIQQVLRFYIKYG